MAEGSGYHQERQKKGDVHTTPKVLWDAYPLPLFLYLLQPVQPVGLISLKNAY